MTEVITPKDISDYIKYKKNRAELAFKIEFASNSGNPNHVVELKKELASVEGHLSAFDAKFKRVSFVIVIPGDSQISKLSEKINSSSHDEIVNAMTLKSGDLYDTLTERGRLMKKNFEMREEIGKLNVLLYKLDAKARNKFESDIRNSSSSISLDGKFKEDTSKVVLQKILLRLGISVSEGDNAPSCEETEINLENRKVWVSKKVESEFHKNVEETKKVVAKIQIKNAERQIRNFSEEEEKEFAKIQHVYLELLKQRDTLLKEYNDEFNESVSIKK